MSWAAHPFETYAIQAPLPKRWAGQVSYLAIVAGDQSVVVVSKIPVDAPDPATLLPDSLQ